MSTNYEFRFFLLTYQPLGTELDPSPKLGAVVGMSGWLPFVGRLQALSMMFEKDQGHIDNRDSSNPRSVDVLQQLCKLASVPTLPTNTHILATPVFLGHGALDQKVSLRHGQLARAVLRQLSIDVEWREYAEEGHWYCQDEIDDIVKFLENKVGIKLNLTSQRARLAKAQAKTDMCGASVEAPNIDIIFED